QRREHDDRHRARECPRDPAPAAVGAGYSEDQTRRVDHDEADGGVGERGLVEGERDDGEPEVAGVAPGAGGDDDRATVTGQTSCKRGGRDRARDKGEEGRERDPTDRIRGEAGVRERVEDERRTDDPVRELGEWLWRDAKPTSGDDADRDQDEHRSEDVEEDLGEGTHRRHRSGRGCRRERLALSWSLSIAGWSSPVARRAHNPKVAG